MAKTGDRKLTIDTGESVITKEDESMDYISRDNAHVR